MAQVFHTLSAELTLSKQLVESQAAVEDAFEIWQSLVKESPSNIDYRFGLADAYSTKGMSHLWWGGQNEQAEASLRQAVKLLSDLEQEHPGNREIRKTLSSALSNLGIVLAWTDRHAEAEEVLRLALALDESLLEDFPDEPVMKDKLAGTLHNLSRVILSLGRTAECEALWKRCLAILQDLTELHPEIPEYNERFIDRLIRISSILIQQEKVEEAWEYLQQAIDRARSCRASNPEASEWLADALAPKITIDHMRGDREAAIRSVEEWSGCLRTRPFDGSKDSLLRMARHLLRELAEGPRDAPRPSPRWLEARRKGDSLRFMALSREIGRRTPESDNPRSFTEISDYLSTVPTELRDPGLALRFAEKALALKPDEVSYQSLSWARYRVGDWEGCIESAMKTDAPTNGSFFVAMAHWKLGERVQAQAVFDRADKWLPRYEKSWYERRRERGEVTHPEPWMLRNVREEAVNLLGRPEEPEIIEPPAANELGTVPVRLNSVEQENYAQTESTFLACQNLRQSSDPSGWQMFDARSMVGAAWLGLGLDERAVAG